jgi:hypothetical protein
MAIVLDTAVTGTSSGTTTGATSTACAALTTAQAGELIVLHCFNALYGTGTPPAVTSITDTAGLTWTKRSANATTTSNMEVWWAVAPAVLSSDVITVNWSVAGDDAAVTATAFQGVNTAAPWDTNAALPSWAATATGGTPSNAGVSTTNPYDYLLFACATNGGSVGNVPSNMTSIAYVQNAQGHNFASIRVGGQQLGGALSSATLTWGSTVSTASDTAHSYVDALVAAPSSTISLRGTAVSSNANGTSITVNLPTGVIPGDVCLLAASNAVGNTFPTSGVMAAPSGWTTICATANFLLCYRVNQWQDPTTATVTSANSGLFEVVIIGYTGVDVTTPVTSSSSCVQSAQSSSTTFTSNVCHAPTATPKHTTGQLVCFYGIQASGGSSISNLSLPSGLTQQAYSVAGPSLAVADKALTSAAATGAQDATWTLTTPYSNFGGQIVLKPQTATAAAQAVASQVSGLLLFGNTSGSGAPSSVALNLNVLSPQVGDLLLVAWNGTNTSWTTAPVTAPSGWNTVSTNGPEQVFSRVVASGDTVTPTFTSTNGAQEYSAAVALIRGSNGATPTVDKVGTASGTAGTATVAAQTPTGTNEALINVFSSSIGGNNASGTWSAAPAGTTNTLQQTGGPNAIFGFAEMISAATAAQTGTNTAANTTIGYSILAKVASAAVTPTRPRQMLLT